MTGQVKEDILCRWGELGVIVEDGHVAFRPSLLREAEFLSSPGTFRYVDVHGDKQSLPLDADSLAFTYCQVPVVYRRSATPSLRFFGSDGIVTEVEGSALSSEISSEVFQRTGYVGRIDVALLPAL